MSGHKYYAMCTLGPVKQVFLVAQEVAGVAIYSTIVLNSLHPHPV